MSLPVPWLEVWVGEMPDTSGAITVFAPSRWSPSLLKTAVESPTSTYMSAGRGCASTDDFQLGCGYVHDRRDGQRQDVVEGPVGIAAYGDAGGRSLSEPR
jgi:hypothetical protein